MLGFNVSFTLIKMKICATDFRQANNNRIAGQLTFRPCANLWHVTAAQIWLGFFLLSLLYFIFRFFWPFAVSLLGSWSAGLLVCCTHSSRLRGVNLLKHIKPFGENVASLIPSPMASSKANSYIYRFATRL